MSSSTQQAIALEVYVEHYDSRQSSDSQAEFVTSPIAIATWQSWFAHWLEQIQSDLPAADGYELSLRLTNDLEIQTLNHRYRQQNKPTDVLAFAALETIMPQVIGDGSFKDPLYLGDIVISLETALRQAQEQNHSLTKELAWLAAHGFLHLLGWDHPDEVSLERMLLEQAKLLKLVGVT